MPADFRSYLSDVKKNIREISVDQLKQKMDQGDAFTLIDIREKDEQQNGVLPKATLIARGFLELKIEDTAPDRNQDIVLYCAGGTRSALGAAALQALGYTRVQSLAGGYGAWQHKGLPIETRASLTAEQRHRYTRHIILPEVGEAGQLKLLQSKVLLIGAGGLGSPAALYLAAAGVGTLGIIDNDVVDRSNLQRQILHNEGTVGMPKVESAKQTLNALNPDVTVVAHNERLSSDNIRSILEKYDVIVNGCDNFSTRYLLNDAAVLMNKPIVDGSIFRFEGQCSVIMPHQGPCYRCLYPTPPPPDMAPSCQEAGVFGVLPGIIGCLQGVEVIKLLLGIGEPLVGRLLMYDALKEKFREMKIRRDVTCPVCGDHPTITEIKDEAWYCAMPA